MSNLSFPDPTFGWFFVVSLIFLLCVAAWKDTRSARIPNRLTILIFASGLLMSGVRGGMMAANDQPLWLFETGSAWLGVIDGLLFGIIGFVVTFAVMFGLWTLGMVGGGDVKLFAAVAAWVGLTKTLFLVWLGSVLMLFFWVGGRVLLGGLSPRKVQKTLEAVRETKGRPEVPGKASKIRVTYSLPIAVAAAAVFLWTFRVELQLVPPKQPTAQQGNSAHGPPPHNNA